jgi:hypothetical protein
MPVLRLCFGSAQDGSERRYCGFDRFAAFVAIFAQNSNEKCEKTSRALHQTAKNRRIHGLQDIAQILKFGR